MPNSVMADVMASTLRCARSSRARNPELLDVLEEILGNKMVTDLEAKILAWIRKETGGIAFDYTRYPDFVREFGPALNDIAKQEKAHHTASLEAIKRNYKPGPSKKAG